MKIKIINDVYNISNRIKQIDRGYFIVYDTSKNNFEIHSSRQLGNTYCLTVPYSKLDARTLYYVEKTKVKNIDDILNKIENENKLKDSENKTKTLNEANGMIEENLKRR